MIHNVTRFSSSKLKTTVLTMTNGFDIEKLATKDLALFIELCEKYPLKTEMIYIIKCDKVDEDVEVVNVDDVENVMEVNDPVDKSSDEPDSEIKPVNKPVNKPDRIINNYGGTYIEHVKDMYVNTEPDSDNATPNTIYLYSESTGEFKIANDTDNLNGFIVVTKEEYENGKLNSESEETDLEPLFKNGEKIKVVFDYGRLVKEVTILQSKFTNGEFVYKCLVDGFGIRFYNENHLVDNEFLED